jgi:hypothetical protein
MKKISQAILILAASILSTNTIADTHAHASSKVSINHIDVHDIKSTYFQLDQSQAVEIEFMAPKRLKQDTDNLVWLLDLDSRETVWRSGDARRIETSANDKLALYGDQVMLGKGRYGVFYTTYDFHYESDLGVDILLFGLSSLLSEDRGISRDDIGQFYVDVRAKGIKAIDPGNRINPFADRNNMTELVSMTKVRRHTFKQYGFEVNKDSKLSIYSIGELTRRKAADSARLKNFDTGEVVWEMARNNTKPAGGANKNRLFKGKVAVTKGRYVLSYFNDDSHHYNDFNASPPFDPDAWGISVYVDKSKDKSVAVELFDPELKLLSLEIARLTEVGDNAFRRQYFALTQPTQVRVVALGEGDDDDMLDFGWITDSKTQQKVWQMKAAKTTHAGGAHKNRLADEVISLPAGEYALHYVSDDSHSYERWNQTRPQNPENWGITLYGIGDDFDQKQVKELEKSTYAPLVQLTRVTDGVHKTGVFTLDTAQSVRVYAIGEGYEDDDEMVDYAYIRHVDTGKRVWSMFYDETSHAGGAAKNRLSDEVIELKKGQYKVYYMTDGSHSYGDWNNDPPYDQHHYGVSIFTVPKQ